MTFVSLIISYEVAVYGAEDLHLSVLRERYPHCQPIESRRRLVVR